MGCESGPAREQEVTNSVLFAGGRIASSAGAMRRQAALQRARPFGEALTGEGPFPV